MLEMYRASLICSPGGRRVRRRSIITQPVHGGWDYVEVAKLVGKNVWTKGVSVLYNFGEGSDKNII